MGSSNYKTKKVNGRKMYGHRHVMEQHLGRKLTEKEVVHHINRDETDNRIENLQVMDSKEHASLHGIDRVKKNKVAMKMVSLYVDSDQLNLLKSLSGSFSGHIRQAMYEYLQKLREQNISSSQSEGGVKNE